MPKALLQFKIYCFSFIATCILYLGISRVDLVAQQMPSNVQYTINKYSLSPAYAGDNVNFESFISYRKDWMGIEGSPEQKALNINGEVVSGFGLGAYVVSDQVGIFNQFTSGVSGSYKVKIDEFQSLRFGTSVEITDNRINTSGSNSGDYPDPVTMNTSDFRKTGFNAAFGILYKYKKLNAGFSLPKLLNNALIKDSLTYTNSRHFIGHMSYEHQLNGDIKLEPMVVIRKTEVSPVLAEVTILAKFQHKVWGGLTYRHGSAAGLNIGGVPLKRTVVNYTYEFGWSGMLAGSGGTHEINVGFLIGKIKKKNHPATAPSLFDGNDQPYYDWVD